MLEWLLLHTAESTILAAVVWLLGRHISSRPAVRHALWLVVLAKLLTPPLVHWPWALPAFAAPTPAEAAAQTAPVVSSPSAPPEEEENRPLRPAAASGVPVPDAEIVTELRPASEPTAVITSPAPAPPTLTGPDPVCWREWLLTLAEWVWVAGGCVAGLVQTVRILRLRRRLRAGSAAPAWLTSLTGDAARVLGVRPPRVVVLPGAASPMVCALGPPCLLWPMGLEDRLPAEGRRAVVLHELAHLRRRDHWVGWLLLAAGCVWWWHPLLAFVRRRISREAELACDAWVVAAAPEARRAYAEALLEVSQRPSLEAAPVLGAASGRRELERRLVMIMRGSGPGRLSWRALVGVGVLGLLALPAWSLGGGDAPKPPTVAVPATAPPAATAPEPAVRYQPVTTYRQVITSVPVTYYQAVGASAAEAKPTERDKKIQDLEAKVKDLLKELEVLHGTTPPATPGGTVEINERNFDVTAVAVPAARSEPAPKETAEVRLSRITYKLPAGHAEATATFLRGHVGASVLETKADGDNLVVTTTPETQQVIRTFIALIQAHAPAPQPPPARSVDGPSPELPPGLTPTADPRPPAPDVSTPPLPTAPESPRSPVRGPTVEPVAPPAVEAPPTPAPRKQ